VGKKGRDPPGLQRSVGSDVIYAERRGQSQKPEEIYQLIEELVPGGARLGPRQHRRLTGLPAELRPSACGRGQPA